MRLYVKYMLIENFTEKIKFLDVYTVKLKNKFK